MTDVERISAFAGVSQDLAELVVSTARQRFIPLRALRGESRIVPLVEARRHIIRIAHDAGFKSAEIGRALNRDHSTVLHHLQGVPARKRAGSREAVQLSFLIGPLFDQTLGAVPC